MTDARPENDAVAAKTTPHRRRWLRVTIWSVATVLVLALVATGGIGFYFSSLLLTADNTVEYPLEVKAIDGDRVTLSRDPYSARAVVLGLQWEGGGLALLSPSVVVQADTVVRTVTATLRGNLTVGAHAAVDTRLFNGDPQTDRGLDFDAVQFDSEPGPMPAWFVPSTADDLDTTWVIGVHGRRGTMQESLRILPTLAASHPTLVISYRNDPDAPASPDGFYHLGDTEWHDVVSAIAYARDHGATSVVLYGWSMGGGTVLTALRRMPAADKAFVRSVILDSPTVDWTSVLDLQGSQRGLPGYQIAVAERIIETRGGFRLADLDHRSYAKDLDVPTLIFVDTDDSTVPTGPTFQFAAAARPGVVTLVQTSGGDHTGSWNVDPAAYESQVAQFLNRP